MENRLKIRPLNPDEIECRIGVIKENGISLLLYKDARVDQRILDEAVGAFNWKREHEVIDGSVYCTVSIKDPETKEWISKQDVGSATGYAEKEKSLASDSFKRACVNWGIGRELYTAPFVWIPADRVSIRHIGSKLACDDRFRLVAISYTSNKEIASLMIEKSDGTRVYSWQARNGSAPSSVAEDDSGKNAGSAAAGISSKQKKELKKELDRTGVTMKAVDERFHVSDPDEMSQEVYHKLMKALMATKTVQAA